MKFKTTFNVGPSQISAETYADIAKFSREKLGEISHRSAEFTEISQKADTEMRKYFGIPENYTIIWGSSATEMMELCVKSFVVKSSFHFTCGAFSERFAQISRDFEKTALTQEAVWGEANDFDTEIPAEAEIITITQSETSTGVGVNPAKIKKVSEKINKNQLLIIDSTSIMGIVPIEIEKADVWLFSVQKCFGLPAGLGVMIVNKKALKIAENKPNPIGVLNLPAMAHKMQKKYQTIQTPNVLGIYLLEKQVARWNKVGGILEMSQKSREKNEFLEKIITENTHFKFLIENKENRAESINTLVGNEKNVAKIHEISRDLGLILGGGYGKLKKTTFRLANFPNIKMTDLEEFAEIINKFN